MSHQALQTLKALEQIKNSRGEFIENLLAAFERDHPEFIEHLKECGLDEEEIRYCCLVVLGLRNSIRTRILRHIYKYLKITRMKKIARGLFAEPSVGA